MYVGYLIYFYAFGLTFAVGMLLTAVMRRLAWRFNILDHPGERKVHQTPMPLMGGVAIVVAFFFVIVAHIGVFYSLRLAGVPGPEQYTLQFLGEGARSKVLGVLCGALMVFVLGVIDDLRALSPPTKLIGQIGAAAILVASGMRIEAFIFSNFWVSVIVTIFWVVMITNSLNFLDNMDGLCAGVSIIAALSFFLAVNPNETLVRVMLMVFAGAVGGFLYHNLSPARIFMGDAGSMFNGFMLATVSLLAVFHGEQTRSPIAVMAPLFALAVPIFDTLSVVYIRWRAGVPLMKGDNRHFSHRLVRLGMSKQQAVEFIFLVAGVVGLGGALLPQLSRYETAIIIAQGVGMFMLIVLLMKASQAAKGQGGAQGEDTNGQA